MHVADRDGPTTLPAGGQDRVDNVWREKRTKSSNGKFRGIFQPNASSVEQFIEPTITAKWAEYWKFGSLDR